MAAIVCQFLWCGTGGDSSKSRLEEPQYMLKVSLRFNQIENLLVWIRDTSVKINHVMIRILIHILIIFGTYILYQTFLYSKIFYGSYKLQNSGPANYSEAFAERDR